MTTFSTTTPSSSATEYTAFASTTMTATSTAYTPQLSVSAALGIGFAAGVISTTVFLTAGLFIHRCWKARRSPAVQYYEQARLWKGFTPATPNTARTTLRESKMANIYFAELRSPAAPAFTLSPALGQETHTTSMYRS
ncbi:hypothetical protein BDU57DRAFT_531910 [Ampelomyces quisqualis]|uniref:Uncharacterized protein n=1 Tax=Ampelomyces quisqualis TaxID=50730 RepID=A0A6A5QD61_AMPQU|nr:hypothetical protein BDU57DRAFT_531910 [Ampelomyces quisqualis]